MIRPVSSAVHPLEVQPAGARQASSPATTQSAPKDTVQLSSGAKTIVQEATETSAQTTKEAAGGDLQAKRLLAKEAAKQIK
jgi:hypothetical protein